MGFGKKNDRLMDSRMDSRLQNSLNHINEYVLKKQRTQTHTLPTIRGEHENCSLTYPHAFPFTYIARLKAFLVASRNPFDIWFQVS